ncbi:MAG: diacylglycerol kinase family protein, partial [Flavobacteriales bacterium]|nr:diacylglycerol kinase family protein [Flavobacteriales bacterium]
YHLSEMEWIVQLLLFAMVIGSEMFNTSLEKLTDGLYPEYHINAKIVKDVAAGAVLFISIVAFVIGLIIYIPKIFTL